MSTLHCNSNILNKKSNRRKIVFIVAETVPGSSTNNEKLSLSSDVPERYGKHFLLNFYI